MPAKKKPEMMHPRCRGCGHNFFKLPQITVEENDAKPRFCEYCRAEGVYDMKTLEARNARMAAREEDGSD